MTANDIRLNQLELSLDSKEAQAKYEYSIMIQISPRKQYSQIWQDLLDDKYHALMDAYHNLLYREAK
jgi:hypothetical protein